jgi:hypothetical protein
MILLIVNVELWQKGTEVKLINYYENISKYKF